LILLSFIKFILKNLKKIYSFKILSFIKNEEKFVTSKSKYIDDCIELYDKIDNLLNDRFNIINPVLLKVINIYELIYLRFYNHSLFFMKKYRLKLEITKI